jgi:hypothetical protein
MRKSGTYPGKNGGRNDSANPEKLKSVSPMEVEQRCIIKFLHLKGLKLGDIVVELFTLDGEDACTRSGIKYCLHQLKLGEQTSRHNVLAGDRISTIPTLKFDRYFGYLRFLQCEQLLTPWAFLHLRCICTSSKRLDSRITSSVGFRTC